MHSRKSRIEKCERNHDCPKVRRELLCSATIKDNAIEASSKRPPFAAFAGANRNLRVSVNRGYY